MQFSTLLSSLIDITHTSNKDLATYVDYHNSYISKWTNGTRIPSHKGLEDLLQSLSSFFADRISKNHLENQLQNLSMRPVPLGNEKSIQQTLYSLLHNAYVFSKQMQSAQAAETDLSAQTFALYGHEEVMRFTVSLVEDLMHQGDHPIELRMSFDPFVLSFPQSFQETDPGHNRTANIRFKAVVSEESFSPELDGYTSSLIRMLLRTAPIDMQLYSQPKASPINCFISKDRFACYYLLDEHGLAKVMFYSTDPEIIDYYYGLTAPIFSDRNKVLQAVPNREKEQQEALMSATQIVFSSCYMNGFFLTDDILQSLLARKAIDLPQYQKTAAILQSIDRMIDHFDVTYMIPESSIREFKRHGEIQMGRVRVFLTEEERSKFLIQFADMVSMYQEARVVLLHDHLSPFSRSLSQFAITYTGTQAYLKKDIAYSDPDGQIIYKFASNAVIQNIGQLLDNTIEQASTGMSREVFADYLRSMAH